MILSIPLWKIIFYILIIICLILIFTKGNNNSDNKNNNNLDINDIKIINKEENDLHSYIIKKTLEPKQVKTVGSKILCNSVSEITGQKLIIDQHIQGTKNPISSSNMIVNCYDDITKTAYDYLPKSYYFYNGTDYANSDIDEFYNRMYLNELKKKQLNDNNIKYIEIPYSIDKCYIEDNKMICKDQVDTDIRKRRIKDFLNKNVFAY